MDIMEWLYSQYVRTEEYNSSRLTQCFDAVLQQCEDNIIAQAGKDTYSKIDGDIDRGMCESERFGFITGFRLAMKLRLGADIAP